MISENFKYAFRKKRLFLQVYIFLNIQVKLEMISKNIKLPAHSEIAFFKSWAIAWILHLAQVIPDMEFSGE